MQQTELAPRSPAQRWLVRLLHLLAVAVGMAYSYDFGHTIGGPFVGVVLALNGGLFCSIVTVALAQGLCRLWPAAQPHRQSSAT
jgi:hypothetical protein